MNTKWPDMFAKREEVLHPRLFVFVSILGAVIAVWQLPLLLLLGENSVLIMNNILCVLLFAVFILSCYWGLRCNDGRLKKLAYPIGFFFSLFVILGRKIRMEQTLYIDGFASLLHYLLALSVFTFIIGNLIILLYCALASAVSSPSDRLPASKPLRLLVFFITKPFFSFLLLFGCWSIVYLAFFPGVFQYDIYAQFTSYLTHTLTTHHPLLHTLLASWCLSLGQAFHVPALGAVLYCTLQMCLLAFIYSYACRWLYRRGTSACACGFLLLFFAVFPLYPLTSFTATKDILFAGFTLMFMLSLIDFRSNLCNQTTLPRHTAKLILWGLLMLFFRNNAAYALLLCIPCILPFCPKGKKVFTGACLVGLLVIYTAASSGLTLLCAAEKGDSREMLSVPIQQLGRTVANAGQEISEEDMALIQELIPGDIPALYNPILSDPLKDIFQTDVLKQKLLQSVSLWLRLGLENPMLYAEAFLVQNLPYYFTDATPGGIGAGVNVRMADYGLYETPLAPQLRESYEKFAYMPLETGVPFYYLLSHPAFWVYVLLIFMGYALYQKNYVVCSSGFLLLLIWFTFLLGPFAVLRYTFYLAPCVLIFSVSTLRPITVFLDKHPPRGYDKQ